MSKHAQKRGLTIYRFARNDKSFPALLFCVCYLLSGCTWDQLNPIKPPIAPPPPVESFVLRNGSLNVEPQPKEKTPEAELAGAHEYYRREEYDKAQKLYHHVSKNEKNAASVIQEALYYEAESLRLQGKLPDAADTYANLLRNHTINPYKDLATQHIYEIATYWLQDTWEEVRESQERREGKRWMVWPRFVSFDKRKPFIDREGRAVERLNDVSVYEGRGGPYADKSLYLCGYVAWFKEDYIEADQKFTTLTKTYPESPFAPYAIELAIKAKLMSTGGEMYDGRRVADARKLVDEALRMPEMTPEKRQDLVKLLACITAQQAEKDFQMAEFWRRTGHPGSAYFYYEIVRRRYPHTDTAERATKRMMEIYSKMAQEQREKMGPPPQGSDGRPSELLPPPRRVANGPEQVPMPPPSPASPETAPMPQKVPGPLPPGVGGN
ncbi:MAG TPA: outer membrane protein assembly factor BamD [Gemmataceae bacterium]|nr:outer membrane protein assembly factor BamD [Gemmataceae bacterium]